MTTRRFILGTAGHVDHGKTALVRTLTGWDTDRLKEEKQRGISIELGFAPLQLDSGTMLGIVDVPGHERFVRQMVAGAGGIDLAMLVIAADEGVMPQTHEHLEVLQSLEVLHGVVVITKCDLATAEMRTIVAEETAELVAGTFLENARVITASATTGEGIDTLKAALADLTAEIHARDANGAFRLAVDRVFHRPGIGVVVTGSCYSGTVAVGDSVVLLPNERNARVREIQSFLDERERGYAGERLAIALQGVKLADVSRGDTLATPGAFPVGTLVDARIHVAAYAEFELKQRERVRVHHGAREVLGRLVLLDKDVLRSGVTGLVQLRLETPLVSAEGDAFVVRKYSPARVVGGGRIIDPSATRHRRHDEAVLDHLRLQEAGDPTDKLQRTIADAGLEGVAVDDAGSGAGEVAARDAGAGLHADERIVRIGDRLYDAGCIAALGNAITEAVTAHARRHPLRRGVDKEEIRQRVGFPGTRAMFNLMLEQLSRSHPITVHENKVRWRDGAELDAETRRQLDALVTTYRQAGIAFPGDEEVAKAWRGASPVTDALQYLMDEGQLVRVAPGYHVDAAALAACLEALKDWFAHNTDLSVGDFKRMFTVTRKHAIPLLEYLDSRRLTVRRENVRCRGPALS